MRGGGGGRGGKGAAGRGGEGVGAKYHFLYDHKIDRSTKKTAEQRTILSGKELAAVS